MVSAVPRGRRFSVAAFVGLAFLLSWAAWLTVYAESVGWTSLGASPTLLGLVGAFGPTVSAITITLVTGGWRGTRRLLGRLLLWRVGIGWYAFALLWPALQSLVVTGVALGLGAAPPDFGSPPVLTLYPAPPEAFASGPWALLPAVFLQNLVVGSAMGEELGWRGFALPRLQTRAGMLRASLAVGVVWGLWHLPRFLTEPAMADTSVALFLVGIAAESVLYAWLFNGARGSVLLPMLLHASTATTALFLSGVVGYQALDVAITVAAALLVVGLSGPRRLSDVRAGVGAQW